MTMYVLYHKDVRKQRNKEQELICRSCVVVEPIALKANFGMIEVQLTTSFAP